MLPLDSPANDEWVSMTYVFTNRFAFGSGVALRIVAEDHWASAM